MAYMEVLLREDLEHLGDRGQIVRVRRGYGRNYLLPRGLAVEASAGNVRQIEAERRRWSSISARSRRPDAGFRRLRAARVGRARFPADWTGRACNRRPFEPGE